MTAITETTATKFNFHITASQHSFLVRSFSYEACNKFSVDHCYATEESGAYYDELLTTYTSMYGRSHTVVWNADNKTLLMSAILNFQEVLTNSKSVENSDTALSRTSRTPLLRSGAKKLLEQIETAEARAVQAAADAAKENEERRQREIDDLKAQINYNPVRNYELDTYTMNSNRIIEFLVRDNTDGRFGDYVASFNIEPECYVDEDGNVSVAFCVMYGRLSRDSDQRFLSLEAAKVEVDARIEESKVQHENRLAGNVAVAAARLVEVLSN